MASVASICASAVDCVSAAVVFQTFVVGTPLIVPPVSANVVGAIRLSFCVERVHAIEAVRRPFHSEGSDRPYSAFTL